MSVTVIHATSVDEFFLLKSNNRLDKKNTNNMTVLTIKNHFRPTVLRTWVTIHLYYGLTEMGIISLKLFVYVYVKKKVIYIWDGMKESKWWENAHVLGGLSLHCLCPVTAVLLVLQQELLKESLQHLKCIWIFKMYSVFVIVHFV